jgi:hypothetical protein
MTRLFLAALLITPILAGCENHPVEYDVGGVCVTSLEIDGELQLLVEANSGECDADHKGASFECSVSVEGSTVRVETEFQDGKDPDQGCAGPLFTTCEITLNPGNYTIVFADWPEVALPMPGEDGVCVGDVIGP